MIIDLIKKLIIGIIFVLLLLSVCITIDFADEPIIVTENQTEINTSNCTLIDGVYYDNKIVSNSKQHIKNYNVVTVKPKVPVISMTGKPSCTRCARNGCAYTWRTKTYINYCPHCHHWNCLGNKHKYGSRYEQEITCFNCDSDFCINCGKTKYSWNNVYLRKA